MAKRNAVIQGAYEKIVNLKLAALKQAFGPLEEAVLTANTEGVLAAADAFGKAYTSLNEIFMEDMNPNWLRRVGNASKHLSGNPDNGKQLRNLVVNVIGARSLIQGYDWTYDPDEDHTPDISAILEEEVEERSINDVFDKLISQLAGIVHDERLDRNKAYEDLRAVLHMLRRARSGTLTDKIVSWEFVRRLLPNICMQVLQSTPGVKQLLAAVDDTLQEMDTSLSEVKASAFEKIQLAIAQSVHTKIDNQPSSLLLLEHHSNDGDGKDN